MGLVRIERRIGASVAEAGHVQLSDSFNVLLRRKGHLFKHLIEVRSLLEVAMAGLAAQRRRPEDLTAMKRFLLVMREKPSEPAGYIHADIGFHSGIARAAHNPAQLLLFEPLSDLLRESRIATFYGLRVVRLRIKQHEEIYRMIQLRDENDAQAAMYCHLSDTGRDLIRHWSKLKHT
jgi:GntR family transcriptional regulator, transcriptional repressor for pyruvate dehydrogenase complex